MKKHAIAVMMIAVFSESVYAESTLFIPDVSPDSVTTSLSVGVLMVNPGSWFMIPTPGGRLVNWTGK